MKIADLFARLSLKPDKASFDAANKAIGMVKTALVGLVAFKTVQWFGGLISSTTEVASHAVDAASKLGITAEAVQELGYAAGLSGSSVDGVEGALKKLNLTLGQAAKGGKEQAEALRDLGVSAQEIKDGDVDSVFMTIADRLSKIEDPAEKARLAVKVFGRAGQDLLPLMNAGADGIRQMRDEAHDLGAVIDNETAASLEEFGDEQDKVKAALGGVRNEIVKALLPTLKVMVKGALEWVKANKKLLALRIAQVMRGLIAVLKVLASTIGIVIRVTEVLVQNWKIVLVVIGSLVTALILLSMTSIKAALASAAAWVAAAAPIVALGLLLAGAVLIVQDLWNGLRGGHSVIIELYKVAEEWIGKKLAEVIGKASDKVREFLGLKKGGYTKPGSVDDAARNALKNVGLGHSATASERVANRQSAAALGTTRSSAASMTNEELRASNAAAANMYREGLRSGVSGKNLETLRNTVNQIQATNTIQLMINTKGEVNEVTLGTIIKEQLDGVFRDLADGAVAGGQ